MKERGTGAFQTFAQAVITVIHNKKRSTKMSLLEVASCLTRCGKSFQELHSLVFNELIRDDILTRS